MSGLAYRVMLRSGTGSFYPDVVADVTAVDSERARRADMESALLTKHGSMNGVPAALVNKLRFYRGGRGVYWDKETTSDVASPGVTVSVLHTGKHYDDDLSDTGVIYHYPVTKVPGYDVSDIEATKRAHELQLPVYVVVKLGSLRDLHRAWVTDWDDDEKMFLIEFGKTPPSVTKLESDDEDKDFNPKATKKRRRKTTTTTARDSSGKFNFEVRKRYGSTCGACFISDKRLIDAAHIVEVKDDGVDDARNGIPLCPTHHRAFDSDLLLLNPTSGEWLASEDSGLTISDLQVARPNLAHLKAAPHPTALQMRWESRS